MVTTTQTQTTTSIRPEIRFSTDYLRTYHGMLKIAVLVLGLINLIIISTATWRNSATSFFNTAFAIGFFYTMTMLINFLLHVPEKFYTLPWLPVEIGVTCIVTLLYFIASLMVILAPTAALTVAGIFGFITTGVYAYSGYLKYKAWKNGELAQGSLSRSTPNMTQSSAFPSAFPA